VYDYLNRPVTIYRPAPSTGASRPETDYTYYDTGELHTLTDPDRNLTTYAIDNLGRATRENSKGYMSSGPTYEDYGDRIYQYDSNNNLTTYTDRLGRVNVYTYDAQNRKTKEEWQDSGVVTKTLNWHFDAAGNLNSADDRTAANAIDSAAYTFGYD